MKLIEIIKKKAKEFLSSDFMRAHLKKVDIKSLPQKVRKLIDTLKKKKLKQLLSIDSARAFLKKADIKSLPQKSQELIRILKERLKEDLKGKKIKKFLSIDFGRGFVKIAYAESLIYNFKLINYDLKKILLIQENKDKAVDFINNFLKTNSILEKDAYLTISDPDCIIIKHITLPALPKGEILEAAKWQLSEELPFDLENVKIDWQVVNEYTDEEGAKKNEIVLILAKSESLDKYISIILNCNLNPVMVSGSPFNYANILKHSKVADEIQAILDIGYSDTTLCIYKNKKLHFLRKLPFSSEKITQSLTGTLVTNKGRIKLSYEEAESIKEIFGIPQDSTQVLKGNIRAMQVISLIRPHLELLVKELKRTFDYFSSNFHEEIPTHVYLVGGGSNLNNLDGYLNRELNISISKLPVPENINTEAVRKQRLDKDQNQILNTLAAFLADSSSVNLLPQEFITQKLEAVQRISLRLISITVALIFLLSLFFTRFQSHDYKKRIKNARLHIQIIKEIEVLKKRIQLREDLINRIQSARVPVGEFLVVISSLIPHAIILDELFIDQQKHSLSLKGIVSMSEEIAESALTEFMGRIEESSFVTEANLLSYEKIGEDQRFQIQCDIVY